MSILHEEKNALEFEYYKEEARHRIALFSVISEYIRKLYADQITWVAIREGKTGKKKWVGFTKSPAAAESYNKEINRVYAYYSKLIAESSNHAEEHFLGVVTRLAMYSLHFKTAVYRGTGDVSLSVQNASYRVRESGRAVRDRIYKYMERFDADVHITDSAGERTVITNHDQKGELSEFFLDDEIYTVSRPSGKSYTLTYFDAEKERRNRVYVGNVSVFVDESPAPELAMHLVDAPARKVRSNKKKVLYDVEIHYEKEDGVEQITNFQIL